MKARIKKTGEIVDGKAMVSFQGDDFYLDELELIQDEPDKALYDELDDVYWENLKHQAAVSAMQGILSNPKLFKVTAQNAEEFGLEVRRALAIDADVYATALVEKLKGE